MDTRDRGCGYDFEIRGFETSYIEVKGLAQSSEGILLTNKEWQAANKFKNQFFLAVVSEINSGPEIKFICEPCFKA